MVPEHWMVPEPRTQERWKAQQRRQTELVRRYKPVESCVMEEGSWVVYDRVVDLDHHPSQAMTFQIHHWQGWQPVHRLNRSPFLGEYQG